MEIKTHVAGEIKIAELISEELIIKNAEDGVELLGNLYYQGFDKLIIHEKNITPDFFDLKTGIAGEVLQKFSTYRVRLALVGTFENYLGKSIRDFIYESNKSGHINFVSSVAVALEKLSAH